MRVISVREVRLSLLVRGSFHLDGNDGLVVKGLDPFSVAGNSGKNSVHQLFRAAVCVVAHNRFQARAAEQVAGGTRRVNDPVGEEKEDIARTSPQVQLIISRVAEQSNWQACRLDGLDLSSMAKNRARQP